MVSMTKTSEGIFVSETHFPGGKVTSVCFVQTLPKQASKVVSKTGQTVEWQDW